MCHVLKLSVLIILLILVLTDSKQHLHFSAHLQWRDTESQSVLMLLFRYESIQASLHGTRGSSQQMLQYLLYNCYHSPTEAYTMTRWLKSITLPTTQKQSVCTCCTQTQSNQNLTSHHHKSTISPEGGPPTFMEVKWFPNRNYYYCYLCESSDWSTHIQWFITNGSFEYFCYRKCKHTSSFYW